MLKNEARLFETMGDLRSLALQSRDPGPSAFSSNDHFCKLECAKRDAFGAYGSLLSPLFHQNDASLLGSFGMGQSTIGGRHMLTSHSFGARAKTEDLSLRRR